MVTFEPSTVTLADMWSPGWMGRLSLVSGAGTSSYQAEYWACPFTTSAEVPICSSAWDCLLAPPSPTQKAPPPRPEAAETDGSVQLPDTAEKSWPALLCTTYPAQFWLCCSSAF